MKVVFLTPYPIEGPSSRLRVWQYLRLLEKLGVKSSFRPFMSSEFYKIVYRHDHFWKKIYHFIVSFFKRLWDLFCLKKYELVFIQREAFPFGPPIFEWIATRVFRKTLIYDFDDAIFLKTKSKYNKLVQFLKCSQKVAKIIRMSTSVIAGNQYLQEYALQFNPKVFLVATPVDTERFKPAEREKNKDSIVLGWIGSHGTSKFLLPLSDTFRKLKRKYPNLIVRFIGSENLSEHIPFAQFIRWDLEREIVDLATFDIGIMPLPDDDWSKGKCGYKLLQYMATGIPVVCSPVGVNKQIVKEGEFGFFVATQEEWFQKLSVLIDDSEKRIEMGRKGRSFVEKQYSLKVCLPRFYEVLRRRP